MVAPAGQIEAGGPTYVNPVDRGGLPGILAGGLGSAMLTPEEQMNMLQMQAKVAALPAETAERRSRTAYNAAQAQMLALKLKQAGMQMPMPYVMPNGQIVYITPDQLLQAEHQRVSAGLDQRKIALDEGLQPLRKSLLEAQAAAQMQHTRESMAKVRELNAKQEALETFTPSGNLKEDLPKLLRIHPDAANTYIRQLTVGEMTRKAQNITDAYRGEWTRIMKEMENPMHPKHRAPDSEKERIAEEGATAFVSKLYDDNGNPRTDIRGKAPTSTQSSSRERFMQQYLAK